MLIPCEEASTLAVFLRSRPATVRTPGMVAGAPTWVLPPTRLPAAATITTSFCSAYRNAASQLWGHWGEVLPSEMLMTFAPLSTAQRTASGIWSWSLFPPGLAEPSHVEPERISASGATPMMPSGMFLDGVALGLGFALAAFLGWCPRPASMVATSVPCSGLAPMLFRPSPDPAPETSCLPASTPLRSGWFASTPLSITATLTLAPLETSHALVMPASLSQSSLSRQVSACAAGAVAIAVAAMPPASAADRRAETVRRSRAVALVIQDPILGWLVPD